MQNTIMAEDPETCKVEEYCRLCLEGPGSIDIFNAHLFSQNIFAVIGIEVFNTDNLPRTVCKSCFEIVNSAARLQTIARKNDSHLKEVRNAIHYMNGTHTHEENIFHKESENVDNEVHSSTNEESFQPIVVKVRSDLFSESSSEEHIQVKKISKYKSKYFDNSKDNVQHDIDYECQVCSKVFVTRKKLYYHSRLHNKTHECRCGKKFATKGDLDKHMRTHTGEKPFVCSFCNRGFTQGGTLKIHMESVHGMCKVEVRDKFFID